MEKKNAIILADTRPALVGTVLLQLDKTNKGLFDEAIIYYSDPINEKDKALMCQIMPCRFIKYEPDLPDFLFDKPRFKRFSPLMFCRYEMPRHLEEFETVTWLDTDILIQGDLSQIIEQAKQCGAAIVREDDINKTAKRPDTMRTCFTRDVVGYKTDEYLYVSALIVLTKKSGLTEQYTNWCYRKTTQWSDILNLPDQGVINAAIQAFDIKVSPVCGSIFGCYPFRGRDCSKAKIIHAWGSNKFWNDWYLHLNYPQWQDYYEQWISMGGCSFPVQQEPKISIVIPLYKPDLEQLEKCLDSLMAQNRNDWERYSDFEIILVAEPGENDALQALLDTYQDKGIRLLVNERRLGIAASLNRGMKQAKGRYIARVDADDVCARPRMHMQEEYLDSHPEIMLCTSDYEYFGDMNEGRVIFEGELSRAWSVLTCPFDHPTIMFRKDFFLDNDLFYDEQRGFVEDWELWCRAFKKGMTVGCIHKVLYSHRWVNAASAGQTNQTIIMMREMIQKNFSELGVQIPTEDLRIMGPWNGKLLDPADIEKLKGYLDQALKQNQTLGLYDQESLEYVFSLRLREAETGKLPGLVKKKNKTKKKAPPKTKKPPEKPKTLKGRIKRLLKPLYQPFRKRYENRLIRLEKKADSIREHSYVLEGHLWSCINKLDVEHQMINSNMELITALLYEQLQLRRRMDRQEKQFEQAIENWTRERYQRTEQLVRDKVWNLGQQLDKQVEDWTWERYQRTENLIENKLWSLQQETERLVKDWTWERYRRTEQLSEKVEGELNDTLGRYTREIHRHVDFTYRDLMVALERASAFLPAADITLETDYPIAYESLDHLYPHGTIQDNTRYPRFIEKCETLLRPKGKLSFLDLGCSGGGMVLEAALRGHVSIGLEGSDASLKEQRAEWRLLGDRLMTCDIAKPFKLRGSDGQNYKFDVITAWEVLEHIQENDIGQLLENIKEHLSEDGFFVGSIANWDDIDPETGVNWHVTVHPYEWWKERFEAAGMQVCSEMFDPIDLARGGYNPPHCYEAPYPEIDPNRSIHIAARKAESV